MKFTDKINAELEKHDATDEDKKDFAEVTVLFWKIWKRKLDTNNKMYIKKFASFIVSITRVFFEVLESK